MLAPITIYSCIHMEEGNGCGLTCHRHCYQVLKRDLKYMLQCQDVWLFLEEDVAKDHSFIASSFYSFMWIDYGSSEKSYLFNMTCLGNEKFVVLSRCHKFINMTIWTSFVIIIRCFMPRGGFTSKKLVGMV